MRVTALPLVLLGLVALSACQAPEDSILLDDEWAGPAIAYSGYREGQSPKNATFPSQDEVAEDLRILARNWQLIRVYSADRHGEDVLELIRREQLDLKVMLGIWLAREPGEEEKNAEQIAEGIRLANEYTDVVVAVNVGNEVLIEWTEHPVREEAVTRYVREVRAAVPQPVTVADNYVWWRDFGEDLAKEVDFITMHSYPIWERRDIDEGLSFTIENYEDVRAAHPDKKIVIGEAGWATYTEGNLHVPRGGDELKQTRYYEELLDWAREERVTVFFFEAFDEPWKGTGTEGHWGLFTVKREAKPVMQELYPELMPEGPTSPAYPDELQVSGPDLAVPLRAELARALPTGSVNPMGPGLSATEVVAAEGAEGGTALKLGFSGEMWSGVYVFLGNHDASGAGELTMRLRLPEHVSRLELKLEAPETNPQSVNLVEYESGRDEFGWRVFSVPVTEFDELDFSQVAIVGLWNPSDEKGEFVPCELMIDDIHFKQTGESGTR